MPLGPILFRTVFGDQSKRCASCSTVRYSSATGQSLLLNFSKISQLRTCSSGANSLAARFKTQQVNRQPLQQNRRRLPRAGPICSIGASHIGFAQASDMAKLKRQRFQVELSGFGACNLLNSAHFSLVGFEFLDLGWRGNG
jgi:hypothetical protein